MGEMEFPYDLPIVIKTSVMCYAIALLALAFRGGEGVKGKSPVPPSPLPWKDLEENIEGINNT